MTKLAKVTANFSSHLDAGYETTDDPDTSHVDSLKHSRMTNVSSIYSINNISRKYQRKQR